MIQTGFLAHAKKICTGCILLLLAKSFQSQLWSRLVLGQRAGRDPHSVVERLPAPSVAGG